MLAALLLRDCFPGAGGFAAPNTTLTQVKYDQKTSRWNIEWRLWTEQYAIVQWHELRRCADHGSGFAACSDGRCKFIISLEFNPSYL